MTEIETRGSIFISYAWGNGLENKEWVRQRIVRSVDWNHDVFLGPGKHCLRRINRCCNWSGVDQTPDTDPVPM